MGFAQKYGHRQCDGCRRFYAPAVMECPWCNLPVTGASAASASAEDVPPLDEEDQFTIAVADQDATALQPNEER